MKTLILYSTTHGSTAVCAKKLAADLGGETDVSLLKHFTGDITSYDCVVVGSPIYGGIILKEMKNFCKANLRTLMQRPFAVFFACLSEGSTVVQTYLAQNFPEELSKHALACESFGGAFYFSKLNFLERAIDRGLAKSYAKATGAPVPSGRTDLVTISDEKIALFAEKLKNEVEKAE